MSGLYGPGEQIESSIVTLWTCYHCGDPATKRWLSDIDSDESPAAMCNEHYDAFAEAVEDVLARGCLTVNVDLPGSVCPDVFHTDDRLPDEFYMTAPQSVGGGWTASGMKCPTCGFETFRARTIDLAAIRESDAYRTARHFLLEWSA